MFKAAYIWFSLFLHYCYLTNPVLWINKHVMPLTCNVFFAGWQIILKNF